MFINSVNPKRLSDLLRVLTVLPTSCCSGMLLWKFKEKCALFLQKRKRFIWFNGWLLLCSYNLYVHFVYCSIIFCSNGAGTLKCLTISRLIFNLTGVFIISFCFFLAWQPHWLPPHCFSGVLRIAWKTKEQCLHFCFVVSGKGWKSASIYESYYLWK